MCIVFALDMHLRASVLKGLDPFSWIEFSEAGGEELECPSPPLPPQVAPASLEEIRQLVDSMKEARARGVRVASRARVRRGRRQRLSALDRHGTCARRLRISSRARELTCPKNPQH